MKRKRTTTKIRPRKIRTKKRRGQEINCPRYKHKKLHLAKWSCSSLAPHQHHVIVSIKMLLGTSLVAQWMGICPPMSIRDSDLVLGPGRLHMPWSN